MAARRRPTAAAARLAPRLGLAACIGVIGLSAWTLPRSYLPKQDFSGAKRYVEQNRQPGDAVVSVGLAGLAYERYYAPEWQVIAHPAELDGVEQQHHRVWLVYTLPVHLRAWVPEIWDRIDASTMKWSACFQVRSVGETSTSADGGAPDRDHRLEA